MPNIAVLLKQEITRLSRKELRAAIAPLKKNNASLRSDVAALKRKVAELERAVEKLAKADRTERRSAPDNAGGKTKGRISATGIMSLRARLGLSAETFGALVDASGQSVYNWEKGAKPRRAQLERILALRAMGKREVQALLNAVN